MIKLKSITIERAEGPSALCVTKTVRSWGEAQAIVFENSQTAPERGGYDKHDVEIEWEDGRKWGFRLDVYNPNTKAHYYEHTNLVKDLNQQIKFHAGRWKPERFTQRQYEMVVKRYEDCNPGLGAKCRELLEGYDLGQDRDLSESPVGETREPTQAEKDELAS